MVPITEGIKMGSKLFSSLEDFENLDATLLPDPLEETIDDSSELECALNDDLSINQVSPEAINDLEVAYESLEKLMILEDLRVTLLSKDIITLEDFNSYKAALSMTMTGYTNERNAIAVAIEGYTDYKVALEKAGTAHLGILGKIANSIGNAIKGVGRNLTYYYGFFENNSKSLNQLLEKVKNLPSGKTADLHFSVNRYFMYGDDKACENLDTYMSELEKSVAFLDKVMSSLDDFMRKERFSSIKQFISFIPVGFDIIGWFRKNFGFIESFKDAILKWPGMKETSHSGAGDNVIDVYESDWHLGEYKAYFHKPAIIDKPDTINRITLGFVVNAIHLNIREDRYEGKDAPKNIIFKGVSKEKLQKLAEILHKLNESYLAYTKTSNRIFSGFGALNVSSIISTYTAPSTIILFILSARMKAYQKAIMMVFMNVGDVYKIAKSTYKQTNGILEHGIKELSK